MGPMAPLRSRRDLSGVCYGSDHTSCGSHRRHRPLPHQLEESRVNFALVAISNILVGIITEEGFFRGWLWASLERAGVRRPRILIWSSIAFSLWHWSAVMLKTGFDPPRAQVPVFMVNAVAMGLVWGLLRWISGSVIVSSVSHGLWNGMAYVLFGFGTKVGALGIKNTGLFGPEVGVLGLTANLIFAAALWRLATGHARRVGPGLAEQT